MQQTWEQLWTKAFDGEILKQPQQKELRKELEDPTNVRTLLSKVVVLGDDGVCKATLTKSRIILAALVYGHDEPEIFGVLALIASLEGDDFSAMHWLMMSPTLSDQGHNILRAHLADSSRPPWH